MIDFGADMNYMQEGLIPSKYFEKITERLVSANGTQMKIRYELNNAHVCHDNACFKIRSILVKNMTDKVILGLPFINALYPFLLNMMELLLILLDKKENSNLLQNLELILTMHLYLS